MSRTGRRLRSLALVLAVLGGGLLAAVALLVATRPGAAWTVRAVAPASVSVERVEGRLLSPLVLQGVRIRSPAATVAVSELSVEWRPRRLIRGELRLTRIRLSGVEVRRKELLRGDDVDGAEPPGLGLPLSVVLEELDVAGLTVLSPSAEKELEVATATVRARLEGGELRLDTLRFEAARPGVGRLWVKTSGRYGSRPPHPVSGRVTWSGQLADGRTLAGEGEVDGDLSELRIDHRVTRPASLRIQGRVRSVLDRPVWEARAVLAPTSLRTLAPEAPEATVEAVVEGRGSGDSATGRGEGTLDVPGMVRVAFHGGGTVTPDSVQVDGLRATLERSGAEIRAEGGARIGSDGPVGRARIEWSGLRWPLVGADVAARSAAGSLVVEGGPADFGVVLDARAATEALSVPVSGLRVEAQGGAVDGWHLDGSADVEVGDDEHLQAAFAVRSDSAFHRLESFRASVAGSPASVELSGRLASGPSRSFLLQGAWSGLRYPLRADTAWISPRGRFRLEGTAEAFAGEGEGTVSGPGGPTVGVAMDLDGGLRGDTLRAGVRFSGSPEGWPRVEGTTRVTRTSAETRVDTLAVRIPETGGRVGLTARLPISPGPASPIRVRGSWRDLGWPLSPSPAIRSPRGRLAVEGTDSVVRLRLEGDIEGEEIPGATVVAGASGDRREVVLDSLRIETLGGRLRGDGRMALGPAGRWTARIEGRDLDPAHHAPDWPGSLDFDVAAEGTLGGEGPTARVAVTDLRGRLRGRPVDGVLRVGLEEGAVTIDTLALRSDASRVTAAGAIGSPWSLAWSLEAEDLADFHPAAAGLLRASGRIAGPTDSVRIQALAAGERLVVPGGFAEELVLDADVDLGGRASSSLRAGIRAAEIGPVGLDSIQVRGAGRPTAHEVTLEVFTPGDHLATSASGGWQGARWTGALARLDLASQRAGRWGLDAPVALQAGPDGASLGDLCWVGPAGRACVSGSWSRTAGLEWSASGQGVPLAFFAPLLPESVELEGALSLESQGRVRPDGPPTGEGALRVDSGALRYRRADGSVIERTIAGVRIDAAAAGGDLEANAELRVPEFASVEGSLRTSLTASGPERPLRARFSAELDDGGLLGAVLPDLSDSRGRISAELTAAGTLNRPALDGRIEVTAGGATVVPLGVRVTDARLSLRPDTANPGRWRFEGRAASGEGGLQATGSVEVVPSPFRWSLEGRLTGSRFEAYRTELGHVLVSPELRLRLTPESAAVDGQIVLPRVRVTARRLEPTVPTSADVVVTGGGGELEPDDEPGVPPLLSGRVSLVLGEDVEIEALGIRGGLQGTLLIAAAPGRMPTASGELRIVGGSYRAYRQTLDIERGRLLYANSPLDDPGLDLRITRRAGEVLAGMNVTGSARAPEVTLFSEPPLADQEILAYLVTGRPLGGLSQGEGRIVESMARSVGIAGGNLVLARLGMMFGLEHARVEAGPGGEGVSVVLAKQLLPRLEVDYAVGLLGASNVVRLRYRLGRGWYLQSESGRETGADVIYVLEER